MALYSSIHLHNIAAGKEENYASWFDAEHHAALQQPGGFQTADRHELTYHQIMPDIPQPWHFLSIYDFDLPAPEIDVPAAGPLIAAARDAGMILDNETERLHTCSMFSNWKGSSNWQQSEAPLGISVILGNYVAGRAKAYHQWYDEIHSVEVSSVPGYVAMKRGALSPVQIEPRHYCPGEIN